jgi:ribose transport system substrate-binding protein
MKRTVFFLSVILLGAVLIASTAGQKQGKEFRIGWIPQGYQTSPWWQIVDASLRESVDKSPYNLVLFRSAPTSHEALAETINFIEDFASKKVDVIVMSGENSEPGAKLNEVKKQYGIPAILVNTSSGIPGYKAITLVGSDQNQIGSTLGKWVHKRLAGKGKIAYIEGQPGMPANEERKNSFLKELKGSGYSVVAHGFAVWDRAKAMAVAEDILQAHPDVDLIFGLSDEMALGALKVVEDMGLQSKIQIVGIDGNPNAIESVLQGGLTATIAQRPDLVGSLVITEVIPKLIEGKQSQIPANITCPIMLIDKTNAEEYKSITDKYSGVK